MVSLAQILILSPLFGAGWRSKAKDWFSCFSDPHHPFTLWREGVVESLCHWTFQNDYCEKRDTCSIYLSIYMFLSLECCSISSSVGFFSMSTVFGPCRQSCLSANSNMCTHTSYMRRHVCSKVNSDSLYNQTHVKH